MIHSICGLQNDGKSAYCSYLGYEDFKTGRTIFSNYRLSFKHYLINKDFIIWLGKNQPDFQNITFCLDELWLWLDCRGMALGKAFENTISTYFFLQSSKSNANIYLTAQHNSQNEIRIQNNLHRYTECKRYILINNIMYRVTCDKRNLGIEWNEKLYIETKTYERNLNLQFNSYRLIETKYIKASKLFPLYNTYEKKVIE